MDILLVGPGGAGGLSCSSGDGIPFADHGELFYDLPFYTEKKASSPSLCTPLHTPRSLSTQVGSGVPARHSVTARQQGARISSMSRNVRASCWLAMSYDHHPLVLGPMRMR